MSNVVTFSLERAAAVRIEAGYQTEWSNYYRASRSMMDQQTAINLANSHVEYLKKRDADLLAEIAVVMEQG